MASQISHLPHIKNVKAGMEKWDPMHQSIFEVGFTVPASLADQGFTGDELEILSQQVVSISGLDALQKVAGVNSQKFLGVDVSFLNPVLDSTTADPFIGTVISSKQDASGSETEAVTGIKIVTDSTELAKLGFKSTNVNKVLVKVKHDPATQTAEICVEVKEIPQASEYFTTAHWSLSGSKATPKGEETGGPKSEVKEVLMFIIVIC